MERLLVLRVTKICLSVDIKFKIIARSHKKLRPINYELITDSINGASGVNCGGVTCSVLDTSPRYAEVLVKNSEIQKSLVKDDSLQFGENMDNEGFSGSGLTPLEDTIEEYNFKSKPSDSETRVVGDLDLIEEIDQEMTEFDVEKVLEKQNTHDLYCPNCNSCITRRVILRRRRWKNRNARRKPKHAKGDTIVPSESNGNSTYSDTNSADSASGPGHDIANICSNDSPTPAVDDHNCVREPDVFRCLSCFSFFIPAGNGFKLFRVSSTENENVRDPQKISTANTNWFFSIFANRKRKTTTEQVNIIALGLANLIGGLFIIGHNLVDLKNDRSNQVDEQEDRYQETLGRRDNFSLHATLSILSFLIFGLLPPVMYGFSFRKSDDRDLKLAAVGGASLFCIILLATGKAHIQRKQPKAYISTVLYFFCIGLMASGASYVVGDLIDKLLQKISGFESNSAFPELKPTEPTTTWASY